MGWFDWMRHTAGKVGKAIRELSREPIELPEEIAFPSEQYPTTIEEVEEWKAEQEHTSRFIREDLPDEAIRLGRGVPNLKRLTNVWQRSDWVQQDITEIQPGAGQYLKVRNVLIEPDGTMTYVDVRFAEGEMYNDEENIRAVASNIETETLDKYDLKDKDRTLFAKQYIAHQETYIEQFVSIR